MNDTVIAPNFVESAALQHFPASAFPAIHPVPWLHSHFAVGGWSPLQRLSGMLTAHMTQIAPRSGFSWHPHRGLEIYTWTLEGTLHHEDTTGGQGDLVQGDLQRMFSGDWIEHQELNLTDRPVRVIQIWFAADYRFRGLSPHYQQLNNSQLPGRNVGDARVHSLIGRDSPMEQHMRGRLTAAVLDPGGVTAIEPPLPGEDLFLYVTNGSGQLNLLPPSEPQPEAAAVGQYDVILARPEMPLATVRAEEAGLLHFLSFYLPAFLF